MTDPLQRFLDAGWLQPHAASDEEVVDIWASAMETFGDASLSQLSPKNRVILGYDAGRLAALAIVRSRDVRIRAGNHHEITIKAAAMLSDEDLKAELFSLDDLRGRRHTLEYGWGAASSQGSAEDVLRTIRRILELAAPNLRAVRPAIAARIAPPR